MLELADKFRFYTHLFSLRPDVEMGLYEVLEGEGISKEVREHFQDILPDDYLDFYAVYNGLDFRYELPDSEGDLGNHGINLDRLEPGGRTSKWWESYGYETVDFEHSFGVLPAERPNAQWQVEYVQEEGVDKKDATIAFHGSAPEDTVRWDNFEDYLTDAAKHGFIWFWQRGGGGGGVDSLAFLLDNSVDPSTPRDELRHLLVEQGEKIEDFFEVDVTEEVAEELIEWLGDRVVLLLPDA